MGIFTRVRDIVNSNVNSVLDKAEDPEKLVKQMIREMEDTLVEIKAACAGVMAQQRKADREQSQARRSADRWAHRAELAVERGREDLARDALIAKHGYLNDSEALVGESRKVDEIVAGYKDDIIQVEEKLGTARERQRVLVQRHIHAVKKKRVQQEIRRFDSSGVIVRFDEFTQRIERAEADAELVNVGRSRPQSLEEAFVDMEREEKIDAELRTLKQRANRSAQPVLA